MNAIQYNQQQQDFPPDHPQSDNNSSESHAASHTQEAPQAPSLPETHGHSKPSDQFHDSKAASSQIRHIPFQCCPSSSLPGFKSNTGQKEKANQLALSKPVSQYIRFSQKPAQTITDTPHPKELRHPSRKRSPHTAAHNSPKEDAESDRRPIRSQPSRSSHFFARPDSPEHPANLARSQDAPNTQSPQAAKLHD